MQDSEPRRPAAYILQNTVSHARYVPSSSAHAFTYPTLALLLPLSALESHKLDIGHGRIFGYSDARASSSSYASWARVTGIRPEAYLHGFDQLGQDVRRRNIREKLEDVLTRFGHDARELVDAWMLTMPSYLGVEGINPLTVFYCYKKALSGTGDQLWLVVLEVHNTFGERHVYVLLSGSEHEDKDIAPGFTHSWTFPRQFHVSPFNDRSGYYTCSIIAPPASPHASSLSSPADLGLLHKSSLPLIRIQLYTPDRQLKLTAVLRTKSAAPLTARNLLKALGRYPLTLLLSFPRIAWQAFHLHYHRRLDVFARPEPRAVDPVLEEVFSELVKSRTDDVDEAKEERRKRTSNEVQKGEGELGVGGGVGWQPEGVLERYARRRVERFLEAQAQSKRIRIRLVSINPSFEERTYPQSSTDSESKDDKAQASHSETETDLRDLTLITRSSRAFLLILASPSAVHVLLLGRDAERLFTVSDERLFLELFSLTSGYKSNGAFVQRFLQRLRTCPIPQTLLQRSGAELSVPTVHPLDIPSPLSLSSTSSSPTILPEPGYLTNLLHNLPTLLVLAAFYALTYIEKYIFTLLGARFVVGTEPWGGWGRAEEEWLTQAKPRTGMQERNR